MSGSDPNLKIYLGKNQISTITLKNDQLLWEYNPVWKQSGFAISPHLQLQNEIPPQNTQRFLRNYLPEGNGLEELITSFRVSRNNTFELIRMLGMDIPGGLIMLPPALSIPKKPQFRVITEEELAKRLDDRDHFSLIMWDGKPRLSVAGVQDKINIVIHKGQMGFGEGALCSTHILKFEKQKLSHLVLNEYITMKLAKLCGLTVANVQLKSFGKNNALLVKRFDRKMLASGKVMRHHIIDGCQALNLPPEYKYERNFGSGRDVKHIRDGASYAKLFSFANQCFNPASTKMQMLDWALFNALIYNFDAHGKNISFFVSSKGISLAPFYDLVNIKLFPHFAQEMAMAFGDEFDADMINAFQLANFADSCELPPALVAMRLKSLIKKLSYALEHHINSFLQNKDVLDYFHEYQKVIRIRCKHLLDQANKIKKVSLI